MDIALFFFGIFLFLILFLKLTNPLDPFGAKVLAIIGLAVCSFYCLITLPSQIYSWMQSDSIILSSNNSISYKKTEIIHKEFQKLTKKANELSQMLESPEKLTVAELPVVAQETLKVARELQEQFQQQQTVVKQLQTRVREESAKAAEAQKLAQEVQSLTKDQLNAVKLLIIEDAKTEANRSFIMGTVMSFPPGIIASLSSFIHLF
ncbi:MAG: hypothetical protein AAFQ80_14960 [Cyanobacteria bacterium J06621_8]